MARFYGTTAERGLGAEHVRDRKRLLAQLREGEPCWRCGQPMYSWQDLDRDHIIDRARGGTQGPAVLAHASCNRSAGARLGNQMYPRPKRAGGRDIICRTCGKPYSRAPRLCEICGQHYHPNHSGQRTCGRSCGVELRRRLHGHASNGGRIRKPRSACQTCGKPADLGRRFCSPACAGRSRTDARQTWPSVAIETYMCRYCGKLGVRRSRPAANHGLREICDARICQLARLQANNLRLRNGVTKEDADAYMADIVATAMAKAKRRPSTEGRRAPMAPSLSVTTLGTATTAQR